MCSAVRKASLSTITYHNLKFLFLLVKYTNRELVPKDKDQKYAFFENDPKIDPFRESCVIMRQDSLAFILVVGSKRRNQRFDDRLVIIYCVIRWLWRKILRNERNCRIQMQIKSQQSFISDRVHGDDRFARTLLITGNGGVTWKCWNEWICNTIQETNHIIVSL